MGYGVYVSKSRAVLAAIAQMPEKVQKETVPVMERFSQSIAKKAANSVSRHPSGLYRKRFAPRYDVKQPGRFLFTLKTPGGKLGKAEAMSEFSQKAVSASGATMIAALNNTYGRPGGSGGGRILWKAHDDLEDQFVNAIETAVYRVGVNMERLING